MIKETAACKKLLKYCFPSESFSIQIRRARDYSRSSDCIEIRIAGKTPADKVISALRKNTSGISVDRMGKVMISHDKNKYEIRDPETNEWADMNLCEFIEVGYIFN